MNTGNLKWDRQCASDPVPHHRIGEFSGATGCDSRTSPERLAWLDFLRREISRGAYSIDCEAVADRLIRRSVLDDDDL